MDGRKRFRVQLTCDYVQGTTVVSFVLDGANPMEAIKLAEKKLEEDGRHPCHHIVAVHVEALAREASADTAGTPPPPDT